MDGRTVIHVDMDAFFASVEQRDDPRLRGRPIAVTGAQARTVILSPSYAARAFGVKTGMTAPEARQCCPGLLLIPARNASYTEACEEIVAILRTFTPMVEVYSVDESFLDVTASLRLFGGADAIARQIKHRILQEVGLICSVGVAPNKLLAKFGSDRDKPDGLVVIRPEDVPQCVEHLPVDDLWGIGPSTTAALAELGIRTCGELGRAPVEMLTAQFGVVGERLKAMGLGQDESPVVPTEQVPAAKSIGHSMTLANDTADRDPLERVLLQLAEMVGRRMRRAGYRGQTVCVTFRYADFTTFTRQAKVSHATNDGPVIARAARTIFRRVRLRQAIRLLGVSVSHLEQGAKQLSLFEADVRRVRAIEAMDQINDRFGEFTLTWATLLDRVRHAGVISPAWRPEGSRRIEFPVV